MDANPAFKRAAAKARRPLTFVGRTSMGPGDDCPAHLVRYCRGSAISKLAGLLQLALPAMQDWEVIVADPARVAEFLAAYVEATLDDDDRFVLMQIIIASLDDARTAHENVGPWWPRVEALLRRDPRLHAATLSYWACGDDPDPDHQLPMTPEIQRVWRDVRFDLATSDPSR